MGLLIFAVIYWVMTAAFLAATTYKWLRERTPRKALVVVKRR